MCSFVQLLCLEGKIGKNSINLAPHQMKKIFHDKLVTL